MPHQKPRRERPPAPGPPDPPYLKGEAHSPRKPANAYQPGQHPTPSRPPNPKSHRQPITRKSWLKPGQFFKIPYAFRGPRRRGRPGPSLAPAGKKNALTRPPPYCPLASVMRDEPGNSNVIRGFSRREGCLGAHLADDPLGASVWTGRALRTNHQSERADRRRGRGCRRLGQAGVETLALVDAGAGCGRFQMASPTDSSQARNPSSRQYGQARGPAGLPPCRPGTLDSSVSTARKP